MNHFGRYQLVACAAALVAAGIPVAAHELELTMLSALNRGGWIVNDRNNQAERKMCIRTGREFIQMQHAMDSCDQFVLRDEADEVSVQYTCRGKGYGRTTIRREGRDLVQIQSSGIAAGKPFSMAAEARYSGRC